ncbi:hypothetical protein [Nocardia seriolae]|uniref:DUF2007 domain-containing protein n=1 Tax=Nocardia seriolae TaxID=37332 RepID=A0A0B8MZF3_9NOCA|nr:hypothetical protein [Nocardia seriolae]APA95563.1 hypothetical protein NS506_01492 [Nocardia seriolae]MTJ66299.1 hypothetical protein [Nocardia seriolae]MTJ69879.1 hypothetical protein [Nocardia seriolae]MTJ85788.1 hypothetical protein [Nocardia seriolae]MTK29785.1 hypothetical protein [Nocardia seriolae]
MKLRTRTDDGDFGLLVPAATVYDMTSARTVRQLLRTHGVRATMGRTSIHRWRNIKDRFQILVFPEDAVRAYDVLRLYTS